MNEIRYKEYFKNDLSIIENLTDQHLSATFLVKRL